MSVPFVPSQRDGRAKRKNGSWVRRAMPRHRLQLCNKCNKVALLHELTHGAAGIERARRAGQSACETCRDTTRYISRQHILANRRNMSSRLIDWHAVRFIPEIGNMQGIDETVAWCSAVTRVSLSGEGTGRCRRQPSPPRRFARSDNRPSSTFRPRHPAPTRDDRTTFATSRSRVASTGKHAVTRPRLRIRRRRRAAHFFSANTDRTFGKSAAL